MRLNHVNYGPRIGNCVRLDESQRLLLPRAELLAREIISIANNVHLESQSSTMKVLRPVWKTR